jgi:cyclic beta-1,2-glucan synthetase
MFGSVVSENGQSYTWVENAHEIRLTPWNNDPITDLKGEAFYLRDEESGRFVEWVLGDLRSKTLRHVITEMDTRSGAVLARNVYHSEMGGSVAFFDVDDPNRSYTTDRAEFIGRNGTIGNPDAMKRRRLSGKSGAALDPCAAIQVAFDLAEDEEHQVVYRLGAGKSRQEALDLIQGYAGSLAATTALDKLKDYWNNTLNAVQIETPDAATNLLTNGWLNYQALACRYWARSGFYQSGGAFGFRDQLQDVLSLLHNKPDTARQQLLICASRQFKEGDVQHWWHPPAGRGVRTTCSDDFLWLPFVAYRYIRTTGDMALLDETSHFLEGRLLNAGEESYYDLPVQSDKKASFYEHCMKAIEHGLRFGVHGLPLMGSGDWNDGMDKVGEHGKGESIWLAFFLYDVLVNFAELAEKKNDSVFAEKCRAEAATLKENIDKHAWDGEWYRRGYFDDGSPLGSKENEECKIDSIAQSWSVLSGGGKAENRRGIGVCRKIPGAGEWTVHSVIRSSI